MGYKKGDIGQNWFINGCPWYIDKVFQLALVNSMKTNKLLVKIDILRD